MPQSSRIFVTEAEIHRGCDCLLIGPERSCKQLFVGGIDSRSLNNDNILISKITFMIKSYFNLHCYITSYKFPGVGHVYLGDNLRSSVDQSNSTFTYD